MSIFSSHILFDEKIIDQVCSFVKLVFDDLISQVGELYHFVVHLFICMVMCLLEAYNGLY